MNWNFIVKWISRLGLIVFFLSLSITTFALDTNISGSFFSEKINALKQEVLENSKQKIGLILSQNLAATCSLNISTSYAENCLGSGPYTADWKIGLITVMAPDTDISYQRNSEVTQTHTLTGTTDTLTIAGISADGGTYDTLKIWFTNDITCADTVILKRPLPCPTPISPLADCSASAAPGTITEQTCDGDRTWNNIANIQTDDATFATTNGNLTFSLPNSNCLEFTNLGFSIPATATITGVNISIRRKGETNNSIIDKSIQLLIGGAAMGNDKATTDLWGDASFAAIYGGTNDLWGTTLTPADVNASNFGFTFQAKRQASTGEAQIEYVEMSICYSDVATTESGGAVYEDWNFDGVQADNETSGVQGVQVLAYDCDNNLAATTYTDIYGNYKFTGLSAGADYRIEFILPEAVACWAKPTQAGTNNSTTVQFVQAGNLANLGLINLADYCQENPQLVSACFTRGDIATNGSELAILSSFDSEATNTGTAADAFSTTHNINVPLSDVGSIWGLAYAKNCDNIFAATTVKTQTEIASDGIGAIYVIDNSANTNIFGGTDAVTSATLWLDLEAAAIGLNLGDNPYDTEAYTDGFNRAAYAAVGKHGIGDIDVAEDGSALFATNLYNRTLLEIPIGANCTAPVSGAEIKEIALPTPASCTDVIRPWAVKVNKGKVYVGMVCSGEQAIANNDDRTGIDRAVLIAYVYEYDPISGAFGGSPVLEFPLNYDRTWTASGQPAAWYPWFDRFVWDMYFIKQRSGTAIYLASYAQPILSDIEFDGCNMIIGLMDRAGNQFGYGPPPNDELANGTIQQGYPAGATNILVYPGGDLLLAGANADGTWTIESNGSITSICGNKSTLNGDPQDLRSTLPAPHQSETGAGPGGDEFFWGDYYGTGHGEVTIGGLAINQSSGEVISMAWDPLQHVASEFGIGGAMWLNTNTGAYEKGLKLYENNVLSFQKGSGFGDAELICGDAPIEIGNYVWNDTDKDGIQDACESGIDAVVVELVKGGTVIASTQTANGGQYYFSDKNAIDANLTWSGTGADTILLPNTTYTIRISNAAGGSQQAVLSGLELSITNTNSDNSDNIDNDGSLSGDHAEITALTSDFGWVNHSFDFGFRVPAICPTDFCLDNYLLEGSGSFFQVTWDTLLNNWTKPPDDVNSYPYTQTLTIPGSSITVDLTMSRRPRNDNLSTTFSNVAWPSTGPSTINDVDWTSLLGDDEVFRYFKDEAVADNPVTMTMTFSEPILLYEMVTGNPSGTSGTVIFAAYDDSIAVDVNQDLAVLSANTVPPNPAVHPNPGIGIFETASDDPTAESTVNFFAHNDMGGFNWGVNGGITNPAPAPMNFMETYPNGSTDGAPIIGYKDGYYYNLTTASARDWLVMDYAGAKARSISWQLFRETVAFQTDLGNGSATFSDIFSYSEPGNRSAYLGPFQVESTTCPDQNHEICLDGSGPTSVDLTVDVAKTADVVWFNSADVQVGTGNTLTVSMATSGMAADSMETFYYTGTDIASGCTGTSCCPILVSAVSCCPMNMGLTNQSCSDNGTESTLDDYIHFQLNPTGTNLVGTYSVSVSSGTITPTSGNYGIATTFQLQNGSIGAGNITVTLTDDTDNSCTLDTLVIDPGQCVLLEMIKTADVATASTGDIITYTYQVTNNSLDTLSLSDITDDKLGVISTEIIGDTRVSDQLQSLYQFEDGSGTTIMDNSGVSPALDLTIQGVNYTWGIDSLDFTGANRADNTTDNNKLYQSITASGALTVEAWVQPANNTQDGASRIFSLSTDNSNRNFQLMQNQSIYEFRLRTSDDGTNEAETAAGTIAGTPALQHVVYTFDGTTAQFYINGSPVATSGVTNPTGDFSTWDATYDLAIGNENSFAADDVARDWQGEFHLAAVYSKALSAAEVSQNYNYGLDFSATPTVLTNGQTASFSASYEVQNSDPEGIYKNIASITGRPRVGAVLIATDSAAVNLLNCDLTITTTYSANCTEISANNFTVDWKIGISTTNELDNIISYQRNNEAVQSHTLTGLTDTLTISGIPADGGIYDTLKVWFTNETTCADTVILKRPVSCPSTVADCTFSTDFSGNSGLSYTDDFFGTGVDASGTNPALASGMTYAIGIGDGRMIRTNSGTDYSADKDGYFLYLDGDDACVKLNLPIVSATCEYEISFSVAAWDANGVTPVDVGVSIDLDGGGHTIVYSSIPIGCAGFNDYYKDEGDNEDCSVSTTGHSGLFVNSGFGDVVNSVAGDLSSSNQLSWRRITYKIQPRPGDNIYLSKLGGGATTGLALDDICVINLCEAPNAGEVCASIAADEIAGTVFEDWNYDGSMNSSDTVGVAGIQVFIYDDCNSVLDTTYTDANGNYQFAGLTIGTTYRVVFNLPEAVACWAKPTQVGADNGSTVQLVQPGNCASLGVSNPADYCDDNPSVFIPCYINGDGSGGQDALVSLAYQDQLPISDLATNIDDVVAKNIIATSDEIGSIWGLAFQRATNTLFGATHFRGHTAIGPEGMDAIYLLDPIGNSVTGHFNLSDFGVYSGSIIDPRPYALPADPAAFFEDPLARSLAGKTSLGDIELSADGKKLYVVNLHDKTLVRFDVSNPNAPSLIGTPLPIPDDACTATPPSYKVNMGALTKNSANSTIAGWEDGLNSAYTNKSTDYIEEQNDGDYNFDVTGGITNNTDIPNLEEAVLRRNHYDPDSINLRFPVMSNQAYTVDLYFMGSGGSASFDINIENTTVAASYTIVGNVGEQETYIVTPTDGILNIDLTTVSALSLLNAVKITPVNGSASNDANSVRPFALSQNEGKIYIGTVCSGELGQNTADLTATVYELNENNESFISTFSMPLDYSRGETNQYDGFLEDEYIKGDWKGWQDEYFYNPPNTSMHWSEFGQSIKYYPQPLLADIDFTANGSLVLSFIDRSSLQSGIGALPDLDNNIVFPLIAGDIVRVCKINDAYILEGEAGCNQNFAANIDPTVSGPGAAGGEFYDDRGPDDYRESNVSGILLSKIHNQLLHYSLWHPENGLSGSGGSFRLLWLGAETGIQEGHAEIFDNNGASLSVKGAALGDLELLCASAPIEIGNYVWEDTDEDGIQDACEPALGNVIVTLYNTTCEIIAIDTTDSKGQYYFNETKLREYTAQIDSILTPNTTYYVVVRDAVGGTWTTGDSTLTIGTNNYNLTASNQGSNDLIDSDATKGTAVSACNSVTNGYAFATAITGDAGCVEHSFDIGFRPNICEIPLIYPQCGCNSTACKITIQQVYANSISCTGGTGGTIDMNVIVNYVNAPAGDIDINGTIFTPTGTNGIDTFLLIGIPCLDKDKMDVVAEFVNNSSCRDSINTRLEAVNPRYDVLGWDCEDNSGSQLFSNWLGTGLNVTISHSDNMYDGVPNIYDVTCPNGNDDSHCLTEYHGALRYTNNRNSVSGQPIGTATGKSFVKYAFNEPVFVDDFFIGSISVLAGNTSEWVHVKAYDTTGALTFPTHYSTGAENCRNTGDLIPINVIPSSDCSIYAAGVSDGTNAGDKIYGHMKLSYSNTPLDSIVIEFWGSANNYTDPEGAHSTSACSATINTGIFEPATCICCPEITELITTRLICHGENVDTLAALTTLENPDSIAFVYFATAQTDSSVIYTGGTGIDTVQVSASSDTARITDVSGFTNAGSGTQQYFVYAIAHPTPSDNTCRPYEEIIVNVKSVPTVSVPDVEICNGETATITATVGNTGSKPSLYTWTIPVGESDPGNVLSFSASTSGTYTLSVYNNGCTVEENGIVTVVACDWGDLPDISANTVMNDYQTTAANNGPVHVIIPGLKLGVLVDGESAAFPSEDALGDNNDTSNDEEGITIFPSLDVPLGGTIRLPLVVMNTTGDTAYLEAWIDWNGDGDFDEINEMVADLKDNKDGVFPAYLEIEVPSNALTGSSVGFRARLSNTDNMTPYGRINSGEVEDYLLSIACPQVCLPIQVTIEKE